MPRMTPEQEAAYALGSGVARSDLPEDAQLAYDRLVEQRARARPPAPASLAGAETASDRVILPRWAAAVGTALFLPIAGGFGVVLVPYWITRWQSGAPYPLAVRVLGVALIVAGGIVLTGRCVRFAAEGVGIPLPVEPTSRRLTHHRAGAVGQPPGAADLRGCGPRRRDRVRPVLRGALAGQALRRTVRGLPHAGAWLVTAPATPDVLTPRRTFAIDASRTVAATDLA